jgi:glycosyltransferase involved in cell wall biosynthesis
MDKKATTSTPAKRHCMIVHAYYPLDETRVEREAHALIQAGFEVDVLCLKNDNEPAEEKVDGVQIYRLPVRRHKGQGLVVQMLEYLSFFVLVFLRLLVLYPRRKYQTLQVHNLPDFLVFSTILQKLAGAKIILDLHDLMPEFFAGSYNRSMDSLPVRLLKLQERLSCWYADRVITVTETWRQTLIERGVPADKTFVVMNLADERIFRTEDVINYSPNGKNGFRLIYHGTIARRYGLDLLVEAIDQVKAEIPDIHLTIHGGGEFRDEVMKMVEERNLGKYVHFSIHKLPTSELPKLIKSAHVGVVPYRYDIFTDGILPTKLMEYAAVGIPVIASRTSAITAYFDPQMVQLFSPGDVSELVNSIRLLYNNRDLLSQYRQNIETFNERYNWKSVAAHYVQIVEQLHKH